MNYEYHKLKGQLAVLKDVLNEYPTASLSNVVQQIEARIKHIEQQK